MRRQEEEGREEVDGRRAVVSWEGRRGEIGLLLLVLMVVVVARDRLAVRTTAEAGLLLWRPWGVARSAARQQGGNLAGMAGECVELFVCLSVLACLFLEDLVTSGVL